MIFNSKYTEQELIEACVNNDRKGQEYLYAKYFDVAWNNTFKFIKDESSTMDIVNSGFLKVFQNIHKFQLNGSLEAWIRRIVYNTMIDQIRYNKRKFRFLILEDFNEPKTNLQIDKLEEEDLFKITDILPQATKKIFEYYAIDGYNHKEIANMLDISEGTSKWHLSMARQKLRDFINQKDEYEGYRRK
jgi:RNA polymerase sigma factor (sigma-70 family)